MTKRAWLGLLGILVTATCLYIIAIVRPVEQFAQSAASPVTQESTQPVDIVSKQGDEVVRAIYDSSCDYMAATGKVLESSGTLTKASLYDGSKDSEELYASKLQSGHQRCYVKLEEGEVCSKSNKRIYSKTNAQLVTNVEPVDLGPFFGSRCSVVLKQGLSESAFTQYMKVYKDALVKDLVQQQAVVQKDVNATANAVASLQTNITNESGTVSSLTTQTAQQQVEYEALLRNVKAADEAALVAQQKAKEAEQAAEVAKKEAAAKAALLPPPPPPPPPTPVQVSFYQHCDYNGWRASMGPGRYNTRSLQSLGFINNDASSLKFDRGSGKVTVYADDNFQGASATFRSNVNCLVNYGMNDVVSSIIVE